MLNKLMSFLEKLAGRARPGLLRFWSLLLAWMSYWHILAVATRDNFLLPAWKAISQYFRPKEKTMTDTPASASPKPTASVDALTNEINEQLEKNKKFWSLWWRLPYLILPLGMLILSVLLWNNTFVLLGTKWSSALPFLLLSLLCVGRSIRFVDTTEFGTVTFYGKIVKELKPGLHFIPLGYLQIQFWPRESMQEQFPADSDKISYVKDEDKPPEGMVRAFRVTTKEEPPEKGGSILNSGTLRSRLTVTISIAVRWRIKHPFLFMLVFGNIENARKNIRDLAESLCEEEAGERTPGKLVEERKEINDKLERTLTDLLIEGGAVADSARIFVNLGKRVADMLIAVNAAITEGKTTIIGAEAKAKATVLEGKADGEAIASRLEGQAKGLKALARRGVDGHTAIAAQTLEKTFGGKDGKVFVMGGGGFSKLAATVSAITEGLKTKEGGVPS